MCQTTKGLVTAGSRIEIRRNRQYGGLDIFVDGAKLPNVLSCRIDLMEPIPSIAVKIMVSSLTFEPGVTMLDLNDNGQGRRQDGVSHDS